MARTQVTSVLCLYPLLLTSMTTFCANLDGSSKTGQTCSTRLCYGGIPGMHGKPGTPGPPGRDGRDGRDGAKGDQGIAGNVGPQGLPGVIGPAGATGKDGAKGDLGAQGPPGQKGERGEPGNPGIMPFKNWKECAWKNVNDDKDNGLIKECLFTKNFSDTAVRVVWVGALRITGCVNCCKRWYFTFNGAECSGPLPIDGVIYLNVKNENPHRVRQIEGHCNNIHQGRVRVGFSVGNCVGYSGSVDAYTGWNSVSRIIIEEVPKAQT